MEIDLRICECQDNFDNIDDMFDIYPHRIINDYEYMLQKIYDQEVLINDLRSIIRSYKERY